MASAVDFSKKSIVVITGASKGIGQTIAVELARQLNQHSVFVLIARSLEGLNDTKLKISEVDKSLTVVTYVVDLSKPDVNLYNDLFAKVLGSVDTSGIEFGYIFHNAGSIGALKETTELSDVETWRQYYDFNVLSAVLLNNVFVEKLRPIAPQLVVVNITSLCGRKPFVNMSMYGSGKAARELVFKVFAEEQPRVIVLNYSPGPVQTEMFDTICDSAQSEELRLAFKGTREKGVLTTEQTVEKLIGLLEKGDFKSGDTIDYFDRI